MAENEYIHFNSRKGSCDILPSKTDSLEIYDESPPSFIFNSGNVIHKNEYNNSKVTFTDNNDGGFGTGSDDDSLTSSEQSNSPETSENLVSNNFFEFWNKFTQANENKESIKSSDINSLSFKDSASNSSNNEEPEMTLTALLSSIDVENSSIPSNGKCSSTVGCDKFSSATNVIQEQSTNFKSNLDDNLSTRDLYKYINPQDENDNTPEFISQDSVNSNDNIYSDFNSTSVKLSDTSYINDGTLSDLLSSANLDDNNKSVKHCNLLNSERSMKDGYANTEYNLDYSKDSSASYDSTNNSDLCLSDMLASISFEEDNCNEKCVSDLLSSKTFSDENNDIINLVNNSSEPKILDNLLQDPSGKEIGEISLAALAVKHLASTQISNLISPENENENLSLAALAEKHLSLMQDSSPSNCLTDEFKNMSPCSCTSNDYESVTVLLKNFEPSSKLKPIQAESENINNGLSMLDLLSSLNIKEICSEDGYCNKDSARHQFDETTTESAQFIRQETVIEKKPDLLEVDLTTCLKSTAKSSSIPCNNENVIKKDEVDNFTESCNLSAFHYLPVSSLIPNANLVSTNTNRVKCKANQSLFAKALSCKPKKNSSAMYKVLNIKKNLCNHYFQPLSSVPSKNLTKQAKTVFIDQTNSCVTMSCGIRSFNP